MGLSDELEDFIKPSGELCEECDQYSNFRQGTWKKGKVEIDCIPTMSPKDRRPFKSCNKKFPKCEKYLHKLLIKYNILKE